MEYVKINSLWKRQEYVKGLPKGSHGHLIVGQYSEPEFGSINLWRVDEKIDGTNIRIMYSNEEEFLIVRFCGRTSNAQIPCHLLDYLQAHFTKERLYNQFKEQSSVILFGEGYGPRIQAAGSHYRKDVGFVLFDVWVGGWWLTRDSMREIAHRLEIPSVPEIGVMSEYEVVDFVKSKPLSRCSMNPQMMEGVVCRSEPLMLFRNGKPIMWKLKCKEFE